MINKKSEEAVKKATFSSFRRPLYSSYCFYQIPKTIEPLLLGGSGGLPTDVCTSGNYDHVILLLLDGFGWSFFEEYLSRLSSLQNIEKRARVSKLTSMFPSTTAAHITCLNSGLAPNESGIYEWFIYDPLVDGIIKPLPYSFADDKKIETLPPEIKQIFPQHTLYQQWGEKGIHSHVFHPKEISKSTYSMTLLQGANVHGYKHHKQGLQKVLECLKPKTYCCYYYKEIDSAGHHQGIDTPEFNRAVENIFIEIEQFLEKLPSKTAVMITADHGMTPVDPQTTYYLNQEIPNIERYFRRGRLDQPLVPAGSCRDFFVHAKPELKGEMKAILESHLAGKAEVFLVEELLNAKLFGPHLDRENFLKRVGDLVILPYKGEAIWWFEQDHFSQDFYAAHGGLTPEEMEIPLIFVAT